MSNRSTTASSSKFQQIIDDALKVYHKRTKSDLLLHPLATELQNCDSSTDVHAVLQRQVHQSRSGDDRWTKWLNPTINVLLTFSGTVGTVGLAFSPATVIFAGIGVLLSAAKDVCASQETILDIFERIEMFFRRLEMYTEVPLTTEMTDVIIEIMTEVLSVLGIATKEIKQSQTKKYMKRLIGRTDMEDALKRLDKLTREEARMAVVENLKATHAVDERVRGVASTVVAIDNSVARVDDRVAGVNDQVAGIGDRVADVDDKVAIVNDNLVSVDDRVAGVDNRVAGVDNRVAGVDNRVAGVDNRVAGIDDRLAGVDNTVAIVSDNVASVGDKVAGVDDAVKSVDTRVAIVDDRLGVVDDKVDDLIHGGEEMKVVMREAANDLDQIKRNQLRVETYKWLSPPDPSTNHGIACDTHHKKSADWFFQSTIYREWKSKGSLLWVHGKPGSGKSVLCSTVIEDIKAMCEAVNTSMAYFYFDFRNAGKQALQDLVRSLLIQLSVHSAPRCDILSKLYSAHDKGKNQPGDRGLAKCLKTMLLLPDERPTYLIIDALDESPISPGIPSPREKVLQLVEELVELCLPNLHICVTSRPEIDIRNVLEPLTSRRVSLHDESGQKEDIADYVRSVVYSKSEQIMKRWRTEDKELVIKSLSERADGMFRWVFCQLEVLRDCLPPSVRRTLDELPESLDETYERILKEIKKPNRDHARRLLSCLVAAIRPLRVEELAEVLAIDYEDEEGIPRLNPNWRWEDQEQAILTSCSSLIAIVESGLSRVVQFSHFSVKDFLTSARLATSNGDVLRYHIALEPAHTILAQACMSALLRPDDRVEQNGVENNSRLTEYAAEHWVTHAKYENASSSLRKAMEYLFDLDKPYFATWRQLHDIDIEPSNDSVFYLFTPSFKTDAGPLYYAALCGFQDLVGHLIRKYPQHVNIYGGCYVTPLVAALAGEHFQTAKFLRDNGADPNIGGDMGGAPLHSTAYYGHLQMVRVLLEHKADVNSRTREGKTPLHSSSGCYWYATSRTPDQISQLHNVSRFLLEHGADVNARSNDLSTPLHLAAQYGMVKVVRVLLEHGASVDAEDKEGRTPFQLASSKRHSDITKLLSEHGTK